MHLEQLNDQISVSGQITAEDVGELKSLGVDTIVCNRPDGEDPNTAAKP